jgi:hypothetical protein
VQLLEVAVLVACEAGADDAWQNGYPSGRAAARSHRTEQSFKDMVPNSRPPSSGKAVSPA